MRKGENESAEDRIKALLTADDPAALDAIWDEYAADLLGYLAALHGSRHEAEDSLQDVFVTIAAKRDYVVAARRLKPYLYRLARNTALNRIKREGRRREKLRLAADWLETSANHDTGVDQSKPLAAALARLPEKQRAVIVLKFFQDKTLREIGERLRISGNTAASCLRYGLEKLQTMLQEETP
jgi:RNA polymerase sigma factor (sigma-70 family)